MRYEERWIDNAAVRWSTCTNWVPGLKPKSRTSSFSSNQSMTFSQTRPTWIDGDMANNAACQLCQKRGTLEHIMSLCLKVMGEGWYQWIYQCSPSTGLHATAKDCQLQADQGRLLKFPENTATTRLWADMVLTSKSTKRVVLLARCEPVQVVGQGFSIH